MHKVSPFFKENEISSTAVTFPVLVRKQVVKLLTSKLKFGCVDINHSTLDRSASLRPSPKRLKERTVIIIAIPGKKTR